MIEITPTIHIDERDVQFEFVRAGGPGGQNVNKVNSKATLRWDVSRTPSLPEDVRARFVARYASRLTKEGDLVLSSQRYRDQGRNVEDCLERLREMILAVAKAPVKRKPTQPSRGSQERRLEAKRQTSRRKESRRDGWD
jgi:ribosome-associated protein